MLLEDYALFRQTISVGRANNGIPHTSQTVGSMLVVGYDQDIPLERRREGECFCNSRHKNTASQYRIKISARDLHSKNLEGVDLLIK